MKNGKLTQEDFDFQDLIKEFMLSMKEEFDLEQETLKTKNQKALKE